MTRIQLFDYGTRIKGRSRLTKKNIHRKIIRGRKLFVLERKNVTSRAA